MALKWSEVGESLIYPDNLIPVDVWFGRQKDVLSKWEEIKRQTVELNRF